MMSKCQLAAKILTCCFVLVLSGPCETATPQMPAKSVSIIRNTTTAAVTVEYQTGDQWQQVSLDPGKESTVAGTHIRVSTAREDNAMIIVVLPIEGGKKYEVIRNDTCGIWDFRNVTDTSPPTH